MTLLRSLIFCFFIVSLSSVTVFINASHPHMSHYKPGSVQELRSLDEFDEIIIHADKIVVDFYAPWCGHCKDLAPVLVSLAPQFPGIVFVKVNVEKFPALSAKFSIKGIPLIHFYHKGRRVNIMTGFEGTAASSAALKQKLTALAAL